MDSQRKIHKANQLDMCLAATNPLSIASCDNDAANQHWRYEQLDNDSNRFILKANNGQCADLNASNGTAILYGCIGNWNQR